MKSIEWLVDSDSDPPIPWQKMRDLTPTMPAAIAIERARVTREGLGAAILEQQKPDGSWRCEDAPTWLTTLFTLQLLRSTGVDPTDPNVAKALALPEAILCWDCTPG